MVYSSSSPWFIPIPHLVGSIIYSTHFSSSLNGNAPFQLLESQCLRRSSSFIETYRNLACWSMDFPCAPFLLVSSPWAKKTGFPCPCGQRLRSRRWFLLSDRSNQLHRCRGCRRQGLLLAPELEIPISLGEKNMVLGHFPTNREGKDTRVVNDG